MSVLNKETKIAIIRARNRIKKGKFLTENQARKKLSLKPKSVVEGNDLSKVIPVIRKLLR